MATFKMSAADFKCLAKAGESGIGPTVFKLLSLLFSVFFSVFLLFSVCFIPIREGNDDFSATWS